MTTATDLFIADTISATHDSALTEAAAQMHTTTWWLAATETAVVDWKRYNEAREAIIGN
jgi:uncharacterized protein YfiM (DUF2279 family)